MIFNKHRYLVKKFQTGGLSTSVAVPVVPELSYEEEMARQKKEAIYNAQQRAANTEVKATYEQNPNTAFMYPNLDGELKKSQEDFSNNVIATALPASSIKVVKYAPKLLTFLNYARKAAPVKALVVSDAIYEGGKAVKDLLSDKGTEGEIAKARKIAFEQMRNK